MGRSSEGWKCDHCGKKSYKYHIVEKKIWCNGCYVRNDPEDILKDLYPQEEWFPEWF